MVVVGVTGGIGCGKSTVARLLAGRGAAVVDADQIARQVVAPGEPAYQALVDHFGPAVVLPGGGLDRPALAAVVFADPAALAALNAITHPGIATAIAERLTVLGRAGQARVVLDAAILTDASRQLYRLAGIVVVDAPVEVARRRLVEQRGLSPADAEARIRAQPGREARRRLGDVVVDNSGSRDHLEAEVARVWAWWEELPEAGCH